MKKEIAKKEHCPYCKRHCPLSNPQCRKGKTLAEENQKIMKKQKKLLEENSLEAKKKDHADHISTESEGGRFSAPDIEDWSYKQKELRLLHIFLNCYQLLPDWKAGKPGNKRIKLYILSILADKGELTKRELEGYSELPSVELTEHLLRLKKKNHINWKQEEVADTKISLTKDGLEWAKAYVKEGNQERPDVFSVLAEEEKGNLELILKKLYAEWSRVDVKDFD